MSPVNPPEKPTMGRRFEGITVAKQRCKAMVSCTGCRTTLPEDFSYQRCDSCRVSKSHKAKHGQKSIKNHEGYLIVFIENQTIVFLPSKMKTFAMVYIISAYFSQSKATPEALFLRFLYVVFLTFLPKT